MNLIKWVMDALIFLMDLNVVTCAMYYVRVHFGYKRSKLIIKYNIDITIS